MNKPLIFMAPLQGITDSLFRRVFNDHFPGLDGAVAPFINPHRGELVSDKLLRDLLPERSCSLPVVPQLLTTDPPGFLALANRLHELGYAEVNWNLGCPAPMVARKRRGSGLLPYPDQIIDLLEQVIPQLRPRLSIKMRLGYHDPREAHVLLPRLDDFPLTEIIIHARLGVQLYRGSTAPDEFARCLGLTRHRLVYNGDVTSLEGYRFLAARFGEVNRWMIGRGLLANPFLPGEIKGITGTEEQRRTTLAAFHDALFTALAERLSGPGHLLGRMKQVWIYLIHAFPGAEKPFKKLIRANSIGSYQQAARAIIEADC